MRSAPLVPALTALAVAAAWSSLAGAAPAVFKVGSFVKTRGTPAALQNGILHGLGEVPKAMIFWTAGNTAEGVTRGAHFGIGATAGPGDGKSVAFASANMADPTNASRRRADAALTVVQWGESVLAEAALVSWNATTFSLAWTTNDPSAMIIQFIAIGGSDVRAQISSWPAATAPATLVVSVGFAPTVIFNFHAGTDLVATSSHSQSDGVMGMGVRTMSTEWATAVASEDALAVGMRQTNAHRAQVNDACLYMFDVPGVVTKRATCVLTSNGFTATFPVANAQPGRIFTLALSGVSARAGFVTKPVTPAPAAQSISGLGFRPSLLLLSSVMRPALSYIEVDSRWGFGAASDGPITVACAGILDNEGSGITSSTSSWTRNDRAFLKIDERLGTVQGEASVARFTADGIDLAWTTNDLEGTEITYLALGAAGADAGTPPVDAAPSPDGMAGGSADAAPALDAGNGGGAPADAALADRPGPAGADARSSTTALTVGCACRAPRGRVGGSLPLVLLVAVATGARARRRPGADTRVVVPRV